MTFPEPDGTFTYSHTEPLDLDGGELVGGELVGQDRTLTESATGCLLLTLAILLIATTPALVVLAWRAAW